MECTLAAKLGVVLHEQVTANTWGYGRWLIGSNWSFYRRVFTDYELAGEDKMATLWKRASVPSLPEEQAALSEVADNCLSVTDKKGHGGVFELSLTYSLANPWNRLPVIGQTPRLIASTDRPSDVGISLPPPSAYGGKWEIPLVLKPGATASLCARVETFLPGVAMQLSGAKITSVPVSASAHHYLTGLWN